MSVTMPFVLSQPLALIDESAKSARMAALMGAPAGWAQSIRTWSLKPKCYFTPPLVSLICFTKQPILYIPYSVIINVCIDTV